RQHRQRRHQREDLDAERVGLLPVLLEHGHGRQALRGRVAGGEEQRDERERPREDCGAEAHRGSSSLNSGAGSRRPRPCASADATLNTPAGLTAISSSLPRASTSSSRSRGPSGSCATTFSWPLPRPASPAKPNGRRRAAYAAARITPTTAARLASTADTSATAPTDGSAAALALDAAAIAAAAAHFAAAVIPSATPRARGRSRPRGAGCRT